MRYFYCILFSFLLLGSCKVYHEAGSTSANERVMPDSDITADAEVVSMIAPYKEQLDAKMNVVIGQNAQTLIKAQPECNLGNWCADAVFNQCNKKLEKPVDFAFVNYGGMRVVSMAEGDITIGNIFELMPFENTTVVLEVDGKIVNQFFSHVASNGGWPMSKGVICKFDGSGKVLELSINGKAVDNNRTYRIGLSDYIANGGDKCEFFKGLPQEQTYMLYRDAFMQEVKDTQAAGKVMTAKVEGRMKKVE